MAVRAVGLDIGVEQVKAVALQKRRHQCILTGVGLIMIPKQANDEAVAEAVKVALREAGAGKSAAICAAVGGPSVVVKGIQLPRTPLPRVLDAVRWSFREHGLLPSAGAVLDAQVLSTSGICLRRDSWNTTAVTQKCTVCPSLAAAALEA